MLLLDLSILVLKVGDTFSSQTCQVEISLDEKTDMCRNNDLR